MSSYSQPQCFFFRFSCRPKFSTFVRRPSQRFRIRYFLNKMIGRFNIIFKCSNRFSRFSFNHYISKSRPLILQASRSRNYDESFRTWRATLAEIRAYPTCSVSLFLYHSLLKILVHNTHCQGATSKLIEKLAQYSHIIQCCKFQLGFNALILCGIRE